MHYLLRCRRRGVGDILSVTALVRDLHAHFPDIRLSVTPGAVEDAIYAHDPRVVPHATGAIEIEIDHKHLHDRSATDKTARYCHAPHEEFEQACRGNAVPRGPNTPSIILGNNETSDVTRPYGVICAGVKIDMPLKQWPPSFWAQLVELTPDLKWVQAGAWNDERHMHRQPVLPGCRLKVGRTTLREFFTLVAGAEVVVCHVSMPMLVASALGVPCVAIAGGREHPWLFETPGVTVLHTLGELDCCQDRGCRRLSATRPHNDSDFPPGWLCKLPVLDDSGVDVGECMRRITPETVVAAIKQVTRTRQYYPVES